MERTEGHIRRHEKLKLVLCSGTGTDSLFLTKQDAERRTKSLNKKIQHSRM